MTTNRGRSQGSILVGLLWCLTLLAVIVIGVLYTSRLDLKVTKNLGDTIQARYLALAGIEKAKALLYQDAGDRKRSRSNHTTSMADNPDQFKDIQFGRGVFRVFYPGDPDRGEELRYGVRDEEALLNVNEATDSELQMLPGMTSDLIAALIDFQDEDETARPGGAEMDYYLSLSPPYLARNAPFETVRQLLGVRGFTGEVLLGEDRNANGLLDDSEDDGPVSEPDDNQDHRLDLGLARYFTVHSSVQNVNAAGENRVDVQSADESTLTTISGITPDIAKALVTYRSQQRLGSLDDLLDVTRINPQAPAPQPAPSPASGPGPGQRPTPPPPPPPPRSSAPRGSGEKLISQDLLLQIADDITLQSESELPGLININTADAAVLHCLPGIERELAQAIVNYRQSSGSFPNVAWLLRVPGMTRQIFKQVAPKVTARSETYRILSEGVITSSGVRQRVEVVVRYRSGTFDTLSYREDL
jgi:competence ComEA-like helix-hairpin-helix protein